MVFQGCQTLPGTSSTENEIHLALLSDTHIGGDRERAKDPKGGFDPWENLHRIVPDILARPPRGVILNGDAASREGLPEDYRELKALLEPLSRVTPVYIGLGNHDHRDNFNDVFATLVGWQPEVKQRHVLVIEESFIRFIVLDSLLFVNTASGLLGHIQRWWLGEYLKSHREKPIVLFVHHTLGDSDGDLFDALPPVVSFLHEQFPVHDAVGVANECRYWQFLRRARRAEQFQAGFVRQAVALLRVHRLVRPDEIFPSVLAAA